jgi:AraC-like DNA-binding protein
VRRHRVLPDNCSDFIFDLGDGPASPAQTTGARNYIVGTMRTAIVVGQAGRIDVLGVRFLPGAAAAVAGVPAHELTDATAPLDVLFPRIATLADQLAESDVRERLGLVADTVAAWADAGGRTPDPRVRRAVSRIQGTGGRASVGDVAAEVGLSTRQLERAFRSDVGISPKEVARVARLHRAAACIGAGESSLAATAYRVGYHDQSHMTREFRALTGVTPAVYATERTGIHGFGAE